MKIRTRLGRLGSTIQQCWVLLQDLHQLSVVQGGHTGRARARRMETLMRVRLHSLVGLRRTPAVYCLSCVNAAHLDVVVMSSVTCLKTHEGCMSLMVQ